MAAQICKQERRIYKGSKVEISEDCYEFHRELSTNMTLSLWEEDTGLQMQRDGIAGPLIILLFSIASSSCGRPSWKWEQQESAFHRTKGSLYLNALMQWLHAIVTLASLLLYPLWRLSKGSFHTPRFPEILKGERANYCEQEGSLRVCGTAPIRVPASSEEPCPHNTIEQWCCARDQQGNKIQGPCLSCCHVTATAHPR